MQDVEMTAHRRTRLRYKEADEIHSIIVRPAFHSTPTISFQDLLHYSTLPTPTPSTHFNTSYSSAMDRLAILATLVLCTVHVMATPFPSHVNTDKKMAKYDLWSACKESLADTMAGICWPNPALMRVTSALVTLRLRLSPAPLTQWDSLMVPLLGGSAQTLPATQTVLRTLSLVMWMVPMCYQMWIRRAIKGTRWSWERGQDKWSDVFAWTSVLV